MKLGLLLCDHVADQFVHLNGDYDRQFTALLPGFDWAYYDLTAGVFPTNLNECDAYLCTGSIRSVYEEESWIRQLAVFVQELYRQSIPYIGICFGHQMMAHALGGRVARSEVGWCVGAHRFRVRRQEPWMEPLRADVNLLMSCQDQVLALPPESVVLAEAPDCPVGIFRVGNTMLGIQGHPEFSVAYSRALMADRRERIGAGKVELGLASLDALPDRELAAGWIGAFLGQFR